MKLYVILKDDESTILHRWEMSIPELDAEGVAKPDVENAMLRLLRNWTGRGYPHAEYKSDSAY